MNCNADLQIIMQLPINKEQIYRKDNHGICSGKEETWEFLASSRPKLKDGLKGLPDPSPYPIAQLQLFKSLYFGISLLPTTLNKHIKDKLLIYTHII